MKLCQGPKCHEYKTKDRIRGSKGSKRYETRKRSSFYYGKSNFCSMICQDDWIHKHIEHALDHFGRVTEAKRADCDSAWYKDYKYNYTGDRFRDTNTYFFINDLLGQRISITKQQYDNKDLTQPS